MKRQYANTITWCMSIVFLAACGGSGNGSLDSKPLSEVVRETLRVDCVDGADDIHPPSNLQAEFTETGDQTVPSLKAGRATSLAQLVYKVRFDADRYSCINVELGTALNDDGQAVDLIHSNFQASWRWVGFGPDLFAADKLW
jgi:hypothetical protein